MKGRKVLIFSLVLLFSLSFASAGIFDFLTGNTMKQDSLDCNSDLGYDEYGYYNEYDSGCEGGSSGYYDVAPYDGVDPYELEGELCVSCARPPIDCKYVGVSCESCGTLVCQEPAPVLKTFCLDDDPKTTINTYSDNTLVKSDSREDYCSGSTAANYYCSGSSRLLKSIYCENGCEDGACIENKNPTPVECEGPYHVVSPDNRCVWSCGVGTAPSTISSECICKEGFTESSTDSFGRRTCVEKETAKTVIENICTESDNGRVDTIKGNLIRTTKYSDGTEKVFTTEDKCRSGTELSELWCVAGQYMSISTVDCEGGCENGACKPATTSTECSDTDGRDYFTQGSITHSDGSIQFEQCSGSEVIEKWCENGVTKGDLHVCENGCVNGACLKENSDCSSLVYTPNMVEVMLKAYGENTKTSKNSLTVNLLNKKTGYNPQVCSFSSNSYNLNSLSDKEFSEKYPHCFRDVSTSEGGYGIHVCTTSGSGLLDQAGSSSIDACDAFWPTIWAQYSAMSDAKQSSTEYVSFNSDHKIATCEYQTSCDTTIEGNNCTESEGEFRKVIFVLNSIIDDAVIQDGEVTIAKIDGTWSDLHTEGIDGGIVIFEDLSAGEYNYAVNPNKYESQTGSFVLSEEEVIIKVDLTRRQIIIGNSTEWCMDTDNGVDPFVRGVCTDSRGVSMTDYYDDYSLNEAYCITDEMREFCEIVTGDHEECNSLPTECVTSELNEDSISSLYFDLQSEWENLNDCENGYCLRDDLDNLANELVDEFGNVINEFEEIVSCESGCLRNGECYDYGFRKADEFCADSKDWIIQQKAGYICDNNFECSSNACIASECVSSSVMTKVIGWFKNLFGINDLLESGTDSINKGALCLEIDLHAVNVKGGESEGAYDVTIERTKDQFDKPAYAYLTLYSEDGNTEAINTYEKFNVLDIKTINVREWETNNLAEANKVVITPYFVDEKSGQEIICDTNQKTFAFAL